MFYTASFDVSDPASGLGIVRFSTAGKPSIDIDISQLRSIDSFGQATPVLSHLIDPATLRGHDYRRSNALGSAATQTFAALFQAALRTAAQTATWVNFLSLGVIFDPSVSPPRYTFTYSPTGFTGIQFLTPATRQLFGFSADFAGSGSPVLSTRTPLYIIVPTTDGASDVSVDYEPDEVSSLGFSGSGVAYGMSRYSSQIWRDWIQQYEKKTKTWREFADVTHPYTFQQLFEDSRGAPFVVYDGGFGSNVQEAFFLREPFFEAKRSVPGEPDHWHIPFKCIGAGSGAS